MVEIFEVLQPVSQSRNLFQYVITNVEIHEFDVYISAVQFNKNM
jgi:hypothetical protein